MAELSQRISPAELRQLWKQGTGPLPMTEGELHLEIRRALTLHGWRFYHTYNSRRSVPRFPASSPLNRPGCSLSN